MFVRPDGAEDADTPLSAIAAHARHIADVIGVDHVALGSDFDGAPIPRELGDAAGLPRLLDALRAEGFERPPSELERIAVEVELDARRRVERRAQLSVSRPV